MRRARRRMTAGARSLVLAVAAGVVASPAGRSALKKPGFPTYRETRCVFVNRPTSVVHPHRQPEIEWVDDLIVLSGHGVVVSGGGEVIHRRHPLELDGVPHVVELRLHAHAAAPADVDRDATCEREVPVLPRRVPEETDRHVAVVALA